MIPPQWPQEWLLIGLKTLGFFNATPSFWICREQMLKFEISNPLKVKASTDAKEAIQTCSAVPEVRLAAGQMNNENSAGVDQIPKVL